WPTSAGRAATPTAKNVRSAATRSVPECAASESRARLWVAMPVPSFRAISATAATTETSAVLRCGLTREAYSGRRPKRPDEHVLAPREVADRLAVELDGRDRHELDLRLRRLQRPQLVMDLGGVEPARVVGRVEAVALHEEPLERARLGLRDRAGRPVAAAEHAARLLDARALVLDPLAAMPLVHARVEVRQAICAASDLDRETAGRVEAEEPDARAVAREHARPHVQLEERGDARERQHPARTEVREAERHDADPGVAVVRLDLELRRDVLGNGVHGDAPVSEEQVLPCLRAPPAARRDRPGAVLRVLERACLPGDGVERAQVTGCRAAPARARSLRREP